MTRNLLNLTLKIRFPSALDETELLQDIYRGLADIEAGRVVPHEEARARLLARYS